MTLAAPQFQTVPEPDAFLALFPHRYDYLWATHPNPGERPEWQTESRHPLSDRLIQQGASLYGVRFGSTTGYVLLDIDCTSLYHPSRDRFAWRRLVAALESLGLVQSVICTSSYRGGLHLYLPFDQAQKTWAIALAVTTLLENAGFKLAPGQLEVFPNCKPYAANHEYTLYNGHRLPMQAGSYLLNPDLDMIWGDQQTFVQQWQFAQRRNEINGRVIERVIKAARRKQFRITGKADKFLNDLNAEIETGWTGRGQTNRLLGRITLRSYIFGHVLYADAPLEGEALVRDIVRIVESLPGYEEWCQHQSEIEKRAREWVQAIEQSHYFHYGTSKPLVALSSTHRSRAEQSRNEQCRLEARERICQAVADLLEREGLPMGITERFDALVSYGISGQTLYRHRDLWHPRHLQLPEVQGELIGDVQSDAGQDCPWGAPCPEDHTNLLGEKGCNSLGDGDCGELDREVEWAIGCNSLPVGELRRVEAKPMTQEEGIAHVKRILDQIQRRRQAEKERRRTRKGLSFQLHLPLEGG
jgi:Txe/YoeB family toxin of Txe-Axe toxin-antitoxin module